MKKVKRLSIDIVRKVHRSLDENSTPPSPPTPPSPQESQPFSTTASQTSIPVGAEVIIYADPEQAGQAGQAVQQTETETVTKVERVSGGTTPNISPRSSHDHHPDHLNNSYEHDPEDLEEEGSNKENEPGMKCQIFCLIYCLI